jgi:hypothetical protein
VLPTSASRNAPTAIIARLWLVRVMAALDASSIELSA